MFAARFLGFTLLLGGLLAGCAMQRAADAETAQKVMIGKNKEQVFACMGIPKRKASEGATEIWEYKSTDDHTERDSGKNSTTAKRSITKSSIVDSLSDSFSIGEDVKTRRHCIVQIVMKDGLVNAVHYTGPTGGFLTEDEQCAYAMRNCLGDAQ